MYSYRNSYRQFCGKNLNSAAQLISAAKWQIPLLGCKFCGLWRTIVPTNMCRVGNAFFTDCLNYTSKTSVYVVAQLFFVADSDVSVKQQIMEHTERCVVVSEPSSIVIMSMKYRKLGDSPKTRQLARDVTRWECRPYPTMQPPPLGYIVKLTSLCIVAVPMFRYVTCHTRSVLISGVTSRSRSLGLEKVSTLVFGMSWSRENLGRSRSCLEQKSECLGLRPKCLVLQAHFQQRKLVKYT